MNYLYINKLAYMFVVLNTISDMEKLNFKQKKGGVTISPAHSMISNWTFSEYEQDEALLAHQIAVVASKNGLTANDLQNLFPAILRMLKSNIKWSE